MWMRWGVFLLLIFPSAQILFSSAVSHCAVLTGWISDLSVFFPLQNAPHIVRKILVGNKHDEEHRRQVTTEQGNKVLVAFCSQSHLTKNRFLACALFSLHIRTEIKFTAPGSMIQSWAQVTACEFLEFLFIPKSKSVIGNDKLTLDVWVCQHAWHPIHCECDRRLIHGYLDQDKVFHSWNE